MQFELTGRTHYGSGSNLATARANLFTAPAPSCSAALPAHHPVRRSAGPDRELDRAQHTLDVATGAWTALDRLSRLQREKTQRGPR